MKTRQVFTRALGAALLLGCCFGQNARAAAGQIDIATRSAAGFVHPGGLHTLKDLERMKAKVAARAHPWIDGWNLLIQDRKARNDYRPGPNDHMASRQRAQDDACAAYLNALRWYISGDESHARCAVRILNAWAAGVKQEPHGNDQPGLSGIPIGTFALAAEVLRLYPGWSSEEQAQFKAMLTRYFYPVVHDFLTRHNGACNSAYWANWDASNILALLAMGVYCDDRKMFDEGVEYFKHGKGMGSIINAVPFRYPGGLGQWQESGRDHAHALGGMGLLAEACQVAWNQGVDLFSYDNNRLLAGAQYEAQFTQWIGVPYTFYTNCHGARQFYISQNYHGRLGNCQDYELLYNHYVVLKGLHAPELQRFARLLRPEGGNVDILGYGTLTFTLDAARSPFFSRPVAPLDLRATPGVGSVTLQWSPSGAYNIQGYAVERSLQNGGPYRRVYSTTFFTTPSFIDSHVHPGMTYFYRVAALNSSGQSDFSSQVQATPAAAGPLPSAWHSADIDEPANAGDSSYSNAMDHTFIISGAGRGIGGKADSGRFVSQPVSGDFCFTARLADRSGPTQKVGLMVRQSDAPNAAAFAMTLGEIGGRQARFGSRTATGRPMTIQGGDDYTWVPVWFRLTRSGKTFTAFQSSNGIAWYAVGEGTADLPARLLVGLAVSSGKQGKPGTATFDHVEISSALPSPPPAPFNLSARETPEGIELKWSGDSQRAQGYRIECAREREPFYDIADLASGARRFVNTALPAGTYAYRIRAYNTGGYSPYSPPTGIVQITRSETTAPNPN